MYKAAVAIHVANATHLTLVPPPNGSSGAVAFVSVAQFLNYIQKLIKVKKKWHLKNYFKLGEKKLKEIPN